MQLDADDRRKFGVGGLTPGFSFPDANDKELQMEE